MPINPDTGEGFDAVEVGTDDYFDPNATDPSFPGALGLQMRVHHWWQGDVEFDTYETIGPAMGEGPNATIIVSGPGGTTPLGAQAGFGPHGEQPGTWTPQNIGEPGVFIVGEGTRPSSCVPELGVSEHLIVIELHGAYGFPDGICKFPVTPEGPGPDFPSNSHWYPDIIGYGEIVVPGYEKLETIGWQSFWPNMDGYDDSYCSISLDELFLQGDPHDSSGPIANLIWSKRWSLPMRLVVGKSLFNDDVIITDFGYSDNFGDPNAVSYKITFKRFRTTSISSMINSDADVDKYTALTGTTTVGGSSQPVTNATNIGVQTGAVPIDAPPLVAADASERADAAKRKNILSGRRLRQVMVLSISDPLAGIAGAIGAFITRSDRGETLQEVSARVGVPWDADQKALNPDLSLVPLTYPLRVGQMINFVVPNIGDINSTEPSFKPRPEVFSIPGLGR